MRYLEFRGAEVQIRDKIWEVHQPQRQSQLSLLKGMSKQLTACPFGWGRGGQVENSLLMLLGCRTIPDGSTVHIQWASVYPLELCYFVSACWSLPVFPALCDPYLFFILIQASPLLSTTLQNIVFVQLFFLELHLID